MKVYKQIITSLVIMVISSNIYASSVGRNMDPIVDKEVKMVHREVANLLRGKKLKISEEQIVNILLAVNRNNKIIVLDIGSDDENIKDFIRTNISNKGITRSSGKGWNTYVCPVKFLPGEKFIYR